MKECEIGKSAPESQQSCYCLNGAFECVSGQRGRSADTQQMYRHFCVLANAVVLTMTNLHLMQWNILGLLCPSTVVYFSPLTPSCVSHMCFPRCITARSALPLWRKTSFGCDHRPVRDALHLWSNLFQTPLAHPETPEQYTEEHT